MKGKVKYEETQRFRFTWAWYLSMAILGFILLLFGRGFYEQVILGQTWGDNPMSDTGFTITFILSSALTFAIFLFIDLHQLVLQVDEGTIRYKYHPYFTEFREAGPEHLSELFVRNYKPIQEFGGWGYRAGFGKKKAFNIQGNWGLQLVFKDGRHLLIGTQRPKELDETIATLKKHWEMS